MSARVALLAAAPWVVTPLVAMIRARQSRSLDDESDVATMDGPFVSIVIPARNEEHNIVRCVRSALSSAYPRLEVIAVDDHSTDATGALLAAIAADDARLRIVGPPPLPNDWFGKQWACAAGARAARGDVLAFFDADTWQEPDLVTRCINVMHAREADFLSVVGTQALGTFGERVVQPQMFALMLARFGGTETVNLSRRAENKIANGQCIFVRRDAYEAAGGHEAVRDRAAEDLALAQRWFLLGKRCVLVLGLAQLTTRMYTSLGALVEGWGKNVFAAGRETIGGGRAGQAIYPLLLLLPALAGLAPPLMMMLAAFGVV
ncbi:MAG TPA: glycosyltransferase family 2 protein, partial [Gemmatimonadaceae bacterium]